MVVPLIMVVPLVMVVQLLMVVPENMVVQFITVVRLQCFNLSTSTHFVGVFHCIETTYNRERWLKYNYSSIKDSKFIFLE